MNLTSNPYLYAQRTSRRVASLPAVAGLALALVFALPILAGAQTSAALPRVTARVDDGVLTRLHGNVHPLARAQYDQGAVADSQPMHRMLLLLQRSPAQEAALKQFVDNQQSSASANYHQWLTPQQFGQQFGPADADVQTVTDWLTSHGFQVAKVSAGKTVVEFSGTAGQVRDAFHTEIHRYVVNGEQHFANNSDPQIPTALAPVVAGPVSLHNFPRKAQSRTVGTFTKNKETGQISPFFTFGCSGATCNAVGPGDFATIYGVEKLWNPGISGTKIDGNGQTIAIVGDSEICTANSPDFGTSYIGPNGTTVTCSSDDVAAFRSQFGLAAKSPNVILDGPDPGFNGDETEGDLDVEWSGAVAKAATIDFVIAEDTEATFGTDLAAEYVVDNNLAPVLSESFGECEESLGNDGNAFEYVLWEQAAAQGITVIVSAGDTGSAGCDDPNLPAPNPAQYGPAVNGIASTPFNVAAGGTDFDTTAASYQSTYWGGGNATDVNGVKDISASSYIPETTWNDSCAQNFTGAITGCTPGNGGIVAGGGGQSNCEAQDTQFCYYYLKPSWQTVASGSGLTVATDVTRDLPDVSLFAADGFKSNSFYIICESDLDPGGAACNLSTPYFDFVGVGGTSSAAPTFAGIMALVNQNMAVNHPSLTTRQGNANYILYHLAANQGGLNCNSSSSSLNSACTFYDITKGNNSVPCLGGTFSCSNSSTASGAYGVEEAFSFSTGLITNNLAWNTATGLDLATGLGSVNALNLATNWAAAVGAFTSTTPTLCLSTTTPNLAATCAGPITITHGQPVYVNVTVNGTVSGTAIQVSDNQNSTPPINEDVSLIGTFPGGNPSCSVTGCNTGGVDRFLSYNYVVNNADIYTLTNGTTVGQNFGTSSLVGGTYNVTAHYAGDGTYGASDSTSPISVTVNPETSAAYVSLLSFDPSGNQIASPVPYGDFSLVRVDIVGNNSGQESATGIVTLKDDGGLIVGPTGTLTSQFNLNTEGYLEDQTPFLAVGAHSFVATFGGDASYSPSAASAAVALTVVKATTSTTVTPSLTSVMSTQNDILSVFVDTLSVGSAPTGSVTLFNGATQLGTISGSQLTATQDSSGFVALSGSLTTKLAASGSITAVYNGDPNYLTSTSTGVSVTVTSPPTLAITTTTASLPTGVKGVAYPSTPLAASGGVPPYTWTLASGSLPTGMTGASAVAGAGVISGTPSASGAFPFTVQVTDSVGTMLTSGTLTITINPSLTITTASVPLNIDAGVAYTSTTLAATGGSGTYSSWTLVSGALPAGITLGSGTGTISGTPTAAAVVTSSGIYNFTVQVKDSNGLTANSPQYTINVAGFSYTAASSTPVTINSQGSSGTEGITMNVVNGFAGTAALTATVTNSPAGAVNIPTLSFVSPESGNFTSATNTFTFSNTATTGNVTLNIATVATTALYGPTNRPYGREWPLAAAAGLLACCFFLLAVPGQKRWGFAPLAVLLVVVVLTGVSCGGGGGSTGGGGTTIPGTTTGNYTVTVTATPTPGGATGAQVATITVTVN